MKVAATLDTPWISLPEPRRQEKRSTRPPTDSLLLAALVSRAQANDESAWRELIGLYQYRIAGFVLAIVGRGEAIEDLTQQVFVKLVRNLGQLRSPLTFESWLFRLARNTCLDHLRRQKLRRIFLPLAPEHDDHPDSGQGVSTEELDALRHALEQLSPRARALVAMVQEGLSYAEIAEITSETVAAVKSRLHRARTSLLEHYQPATARADN